MINIKKSISLALTGVILWLCSQHIVAHDGYAKVIKDVSPGVVLIETTSTTKQAPETQFNFPQGSPFDKFFEQLPDQQGRERKATALGSGFFTSKDGYIVTNNHVIEGAESIKVKLDNGTTHKAKLIGTDRETDLALLKIDTKDITVLKSGNSDEMDIGDPVIAIGNPLGVGKTVTAGIISAKGRQINDGPYVDFIQTDAAINRGNSGGPLLNTDGEVIGVNTAIVSKTGGSIGIGFAVPSNLVQRIVDQLKEKGKVTRGWLGVSIQTVTPEIAESLGMKKSTGALVAEVVPNSPAIDKIQSGDVILKVNDNDVKEMKHLPLLIAKIEPGKEVSITVLRNGKKQEVSITLARRSDNENNVQNNSLINPSKGNHEIPELGIVVSEIPKAVKDICGDVTGVFVIETTGADEKNIKESIIVEVNKTPINNIDDLKSAVKNVKTKHVIIKVMDGSSCQSSRYIGLPMQNNGDEK
jgi:serine protease Do